MIQYDKTNNPHYHINLMKMACKNQYHPQMVGFLYLVDHSSYLHMEKHATLLTSQHHRGANPISTGA